MQFRVDGVTFRRLIHELTYMVCLSSKGKDSDLRVTATENNQIFLEIQDTLGYGYASLTKDVQVTTPGQFYASSSIFSNIKVDKKLFGEDTSRAEVMREMNAVAETDSKESNTPNTVSEPLWFDCTVTDSVLQIKCRVLDWEYPVHRDVEFFNKLIVENPDASLVLQPYIASQLSECVKRAIPFANKFTKLGDQFACYTGVHLQTIPSETGALISVVSTGGKDVYANQIEVDTVLPAMSVLPPAAFVSNVFQTCDFSKSTKPLQIDVKANMIAIHTPHHYVVHQNLDQTKFPAVVEHIKKWEALPEFGKIKYPVSRTHGYISSVCTGIKKDVPIVFQHANDGALVMTVDVARRSGKIQFQDAVVHAPITLQPDNKVQMYLGTFEKALETFYKEGLDNVVLSVHQKCGILSADSDESSLRVVLAFVGQ